jgi:FtsH-binding integral membrane protein
MTPHRERSWTFESNGWRQLAIGLGIVLIAIAVWQLVTDNTSTGALQLLFGVAIVYLGLVPRTREQDNDKSTDMTLRQTLILCSGSAIAGSTMLFVGSRRDGIDAVVLPVLGFIALVFGALGIFGVIWLKKHESQ